MFSKQPILQSANSEMGYSQKVVRQYNYVQYYTGRPPESGEGLTIERTFQIIYELI